MKSIRIASAILACLAIAHGAAAQTATRQTKLKFSAPFQVPAPNTKAGVMSLPPGEYMFSLADSSSSRHVVRVSDASGRKTYSMVLTIPDYRLNATSKTVMYFGERAAGAPVAIKSWFYPGENTGERFIYPKVQAQALAAEVKQPVPSMAEGPASPSQPISVQTPAKTEVSYDAKLFEAADASDTAGIEGEAVTQVATAGHTTLPTTASSTYGVALAGLLLLGVGLLLRGSTYLTNRT